ncbi:MAG: HAD family hydrolase [Leptolyngbya sp. IPPAS B-1204]|nr:HAD family hydrolase [Elainella sp. C42_A2020_010]RNJ64900.1 MAG: HAD family hydrolase [Leptolyngbya sp. IPPAS B-1204]
MTIAAFFDVDGTLLKANIVHHYLYLAKQDRSLWQQGLTTARLLSLVPFYLWLDRISRDAFNQVFYQNYDGLSVEQCFALGQRYFQQKLRSGLFPAALQQIAEHKSQGAKIVLVTGSVDCIIAPLAEFLGASSLTTQLQVCNGYYTGNLQGEPVAEQEKARLIRQFAASQGIDLQRSYAYGDSIADLPMLQAIGHPVAVNPDVALSRIATQAGWPIKQWKADRHSTPSSPTVVSQPPEPCL